MNAFSKERKQTLDRLDAISVSYKEAHRVEWELRLRQEEIAELQRALSDAHVSLQDLRHDNTILKDENSRLIEVDVASKKRIADMYKGLTRKKERRQGSRNATTTFVKDCRPSQGKSKSPTRNSMRSKGSRARVPGHVSVRPGGISDSRVVRAVYLPESQTAAMQEHIERLERALSTVRHQSSKQIEALKEDRRVRMEEERLRSKQQSETLAECQKRLQDKEETLVATTRDYLEFRSKARVSEQKLREELSRHKFMCSQMMQELQQARIDISKISGMQPVSGTDPYEPSLADGRTMRSQIISKDRELRAVKDILQDTERQYKSRMSRVKSKFKVIRARYKRLRQRRRLELTGYRTDILGLKKDIAELRDAWVRRETRRLYGKRPIEEDEDDNFERAYGGELDALNARLKEIEKSYTYDDEVIGDDDYDDDVGE